MRTILAYNVAEITKLEETTVKSNTHVNSLIRLELSLSGKEKWKIVNELVDDIIQPPLNYSRSLEHLTVTRNEVLAWLNYPKAHHQSHHYFRTLSQCRKCKTERIGLHTSEESLLSPKCPN
jgi:hypothetical protein